MVACLLLLLLLLWARALCFLASRLTTVSLDHHSSGRVFIIIIRALCFLASRLTTVSLDISEFITLLTLMI